MIYVGQNAFRMQVETEINLTGVSSSAVFLRFVSPNLSTGQYTATILSSTGGTLYYDFTSTDSLMAGLWVFWAYATHSTGRVSIGEPFTVMVKAEGAL
jgi:hypothetical protein